MKCPKCGSEMTKGYEPGYACIKPTGTVICFNCGYESKVGGEKR